MDTNRRGQEHKQTWTQMTGTGAQTDRYGETSRQGHRRTGTQTDRDTDGQGHRRTGTQTDRDTDGQGHKGTRTVIRTQT
jgi:hypothetical protein